MKILAVIQEGRSFLLGGILVGLLCVIFHPLEPRYQGKRLSAWVEDLMPDSQWEGVTKENQQEAAEALRHIGIRALPLALKACRARDSVLKEKLMDWSEAWNENHDCFHIHLRGAGDAHAQSHEMFRVLGSIGQPAIPSLIQFLGDKDDDVALAASGDLLCIGPAAIPRLIEAQTNSNAQMRRYAAMTLGGFGEQARQAVPAMIRCLADKNPRVRSAAALSLGSLGGEPTVVVPALLQSLKGRDAEAAEMAAVSLGRIHQDPEKVVSALLDYLQRATNSSDPSLFAVSALGRFGTNARPWSPRLMQMIRPAASNRFNIFAGAALGALNKIDPDAAKPLIEARSAVLSNAWLKSQLYYSDSQPINSPARTTNSLK